VRRGLRVLAELVTGDLPIDQALPARVLERVMGELGLAGASVSTNVDGRELADQAFDPVWEAAALLRLQTRTGPVR